jgi:hypothetical protein
MSPTSVSPEVTHAAADTADVADDGGLERLHACGLAGPGTVGDRWCHAAGRPIVVGLTFRDARSIVSVSAVTSDIIRVRFSPTKELGRGHFVKQPGRIDRRSAAVARAR